MSSTRKPRNVSRRFSNFSDDSPDKDTSNAKKSRIKKRKLSDMLGSQWNKEELVRFYESYRKYGKDWKKVSSVIRNRNVEMVEALYNMNRAYLSLPEGTASVAGLIAMMTDHYNILAGSDSDPESNDGPGSSRRKKKSGRGKSLLTPTKVPEEPCPDLLQSQFSMPNYECLSLLKKKRSVGNRRAVGKRTPRFPISNTCDSVARVSLISQDKHGLKVDKERNNDEGAHVAALALAEASHRASSPQVSRTPGRAERKSLSGHNETGMYKSDMVITKFTVNNERDDAQEEGNFGSREAENEEFSRDSNYPDGECAEAVNQSTAPKAQGVEFLYDGDLKEDCGSTEEGNNLRFAKIEGEAEVTNDKNSGFSKLEQLADLSLQQMLSHGNDAESDSSAQVKEGKRNLDIDEKHNLQEPFSTNQQRGLSRACGNKERGKASSKMGKDLSPDVIRFSEGKNQKRRKRFSGVKMPVIGADAGPSLTAIQKNQTSDEEHKKHLVKPKRLSKNISSKHGKYEKPGESSLLCVDPGKELADTSEIMQGSIMNQVIPLTKHRSRRKTNPRKPSFHNGTKYSDVGADQFDRYSHLKDKFTDLKRKLSHCLSSKLLRRWCVCEWFYSAIDYPWFATSEFVEYLNHVGLGHIPRLTRVEWGVIRSSLGKPRRLSQQFLKEEREKLEQYRESVRAHYTELRTGAREGLPKDLARPLSVGQRVTAFHPETREIHDGSVLTVDRNKFRIQFDQPELGVEFVPDIDCMPYNPLDNIPETLKRTHVAADRFLENSSGNQTKSWRGTIKTENIDGVDDPSYLSSSNYSLNTLMKLPKGDTVDLSCQVKSSTNVPSNTHYTPYSLPNTSAQIHSREADIRVITELARALDKKEALLTELKHMNEEAVGYQKDGDAIGDVENFRKQYAMVLLQLKDVNDEVASALINLRQRNTYNGNSTPAWIKPMLNSGGLSVMQNSLDSSTLLCQDSGTNVVEIVQTSRRKARKMVDAGSKAFSGLKEGEDAFMRVKEALITVNNPHPMNESTSMIGTLYNSPETNHLDSVQHGKAIPVTTERITRVPSSSPIRNSSTDENEVTLPSELISSCVATLLMIQTCTERQYPPAEVAQILDSAVTSLQPSCSQNLPIYKEIQVCMGMVKNQILALIPTHHTLVPKELSSL